MQRQFKIIVEKHADGYVAYPLGLKGVVVGDGNTYDEAVADVKSAIQFHIETFGSEVLPGDSTVLDAFIAEAPAPPRGVGRRTQRVPRLPHYGALAGGSACPTTGRLVCSDCLTMPNHPTIKASTLRTILNQAGITRAEFLDAYEQS
jgi:predicted RNase H-like HicB family nuclease